MVDDISLAKATALEKANYVLEQVIEYAEGNDNFVMEEGIFRLSGEVPQIDELYQRMKADPTVVNFQDEEKFIQQHHNVTGLLKRFVRDDNMQWSDEAAQILKEELTSQQFDFEKAIKQLLENNHLEEAKMLHNVLYIGRLISLQSDHNKMSPHNMFLIFNPLLIKMAKIDVALEMELSKAASVSTKTDSMGFHKQNAEGKSIYGKTFDETHPDAAAKISQQHKEIPNRQVTPTTKPKASSGFNLGSLLKSAGNWLTKIALPAVKNFFTKSIPSFFKRMTNRKGNESTTNQSQPQVVEIEVKQPEVKTQTEVKTPETTPWQAVKQRQDTEVKIEIKQDSPLTPAIQSQTRPEPIVPQLDKEEQSPKKKALAFFKQREKLGNTDPVPKTSSIEPEEAKHAGLAKQRGLDHFKGLLEKTLSQDATRPKKPGGKM
ncbi:RhoGAP domain-containing protein [Candidatus Berkiella aquae]|uniref:RhoGAP domain protein n=1 Tax=Candidatus Berkiella aquae TaxID=295108 RepID=A0A0Q9YPA4_9GAMM|nr:Rho GTPase-activating protein [Candidatus Berkiella aquae]MCS5712014.1 RhoGAP domain-containing protein [Candidatus Berkiella aquae]